MIGLVLLKDRPSLRSLFAGNNNLTVFRESLFKQLSFCCEEFTADDLSFSWAQRPETGVERVQ